MADNITNINEAKEKADKPEQITITIVRNHIPYSKMMDFVETIVRLSFSEDGKYHRYLKDYAEALTILEVYTDYIDVKEKQDYDAVMAIRHSKLWDEQIIPAIQHDYNVMKIYLEDEITRAIAPFANASNTIDAIGKAASKVFEIANALNVDTLGNLNLSELEGALSNIQDSAI